MNRISIKSTKSDYFEDEAYKSLRTNLLFCGENKKVIAFTSCAPNEGKSSVTMNLAVSLAELDKKVLLIDADLRRSVLLGRINAGQKVQGLTHYLSRQSDMQDVIYTTDIVGFHIIFSGPLTPNPAELLGSLYFKEMLSVTRDIYDYILIDTPPLGNVIDSAIIAEECDGAVLVIEAGVVSYRFLRNVKAQLEKSDCPILGAVLNKADRSKPGHYGKYYGKYNGKAGKGQ